MKKSQFKKIMYERLSNSYTPINEQTVEGCQTATDFSGFSWAPFEVAINACCSKCATVVPNDPCYNFCENRCCELETCDPPPGGCPDNFTFNQETCHCEHNMLGANPCQVFSMLNIASQQSVCNACNNGTANDYQSNFCNCCPNTDGGTTSGGTVNPGKAPYKSKQKTAKIKRKKRLREQVQQTFFDEFKEWWLEERNNNNDPIEIKFELEGLEFKRSLKDAVEVESPGHIFVILSDLWEMWVKDSDNEQLLATVKDKHDFGKTLFFIMRKNDFVFDKNAKGAKTAVDRQDQDRFEKEFPDIGLNEQKILQKRANIIK